MPKSTFLTSPVLMDDEIPVRHRSMGLSINGLGVGGFGNNWGTIDLNLLIVFDMLMREHSLTRAGRRLGLSQPATSHALARLRQTLNDDLFIRTPEGMQPT